MKVPPVIPILLCATSLSPASVAAEPSLPPAAALSGIREELESLPVLEPSEQNHGRIGFYGLPGKPSSLVLDLGSTVIPDEIVLFPARLPTGLAGGDGSNGFPPSLEVSISEEPDFARSVRLADWKEGGEGLGNRLPFLRLPGNGASGRFVRIAVGGSRPRESGRGRFYTLGEIIVLERGRNAALRRPVTASASIENAPRWQASNLTDGYLWCLPFAGRAGSPGNGYHSAIESTLTVTRKWVGIDLGGDFVLDGIDLFPAHPRDFADTTGFGFPSEFRITGTDESGVERVLFESKPGSFPNPGNAAVILPGDGKAVRHLRVEAAGLWHRTGDYIFALAEARAWSGGENVAAGKPVSASDQTETASWSREALTDGYSSRHELLSWGDWLDGLSERMRIEAQAAALAARLETERESRVRRWLIVAAGGIVFVIATAAFAMAAQRRRAARVEETLKRRLAADLHDDLGASLSHLALQSDLARARVDPGDPVAARLASLSSNARETLDHLRDMVWLLAPVAGTWADLEARLEAIANRLLEGTSHRFERVGDRPEGGPSVVAAREIVLFLKESLTNVQKHASAGTVAVTLSWLPGRLRLEIADDGTGFDPDDGRRREGRGLENLETRAGTLRGSCRIETCPGKGTTVLLDLPTRD